MPIYNSTEYLSVPQQVNKNKSDIAALDTRVTAAEAAILGNTSVTMSDDIAVAQLGVDYALSLAGANDLKAVIDYNHASADHHMLYGAKVFLPASIVNDSIVFPNANDVGYDIVFAIEARQEVDPVTEEYTYIAQGSSPEFAFTINFSYRHDTAAYVVSPTIRVSRQEDMEYDLLLTGEATALVPEVAVAWQNDSVVFTDANFIGSIWIAVAAAAGGPYLLSAYAHVAMNVSTTPNGYANLGAVTLDEAVAVDAVNSVFGISVFGIYPTGNFYRIYVKADDHRKLTNSYYASLGAAYSTIPLLDTVVTNAISDHTNITTGSPYTASNYADKRYTIKFKTANNNSMGAVTSIAVGATVVTWTSGIYRVLYDADGVTEATSLFSFGSTNTSGSPITINPANVITITFTNVADAIASVPFSGVSGIITLSYTGGTPQVTTAIIRRVGAVITITIAEAGMAGITIPDATAFTCRFKQTFV